MAGLDARTAIVSHWIGDSEAFFFHRGMAAIGWESPGHPKAFFFEETGDVTALGEQFPRYTLGFHELHHRLTNPSELGALHGFVFEVVGPEIAGTGRRVDNVRIWIDETIHRKFDNGTPQGSPWPHEQPDFKLKGEITTQDGIQGRRNLGNTLKVAMLPDRMGEAALQVVVDLFGGFLYVIKPAASGDQGLTFWTKDLGWSLVGLDVGDLDGAADNYQSEIVVGVFVDRGGLDDYWTDYNAQDFPHNRGQLYILDPGSAPSEMPEQEIDIAPPYGPHRFSLGVWGVKIDDINADGKPEIWCGDAQGYIYALARNPSGRWECFWRSRGLGAYAGYRNLIFPVKVTSGPDAGKTQYLVVVTPGYVYRFAVNSTQVPF
ncbi:MAG: hypothetical protein AB1486_11265 [Planctomycetota bacterium]